MIKLPDFSDAYEYENAFYLACKSGRIGKLLAHYELYNMSMKVAGSVVECGIFKGASFSRFAMFRDLFETSSSRKMIGFDIFGKFPDATMEEDIERLKKFVSAAGDESLSEEQLVEVLEAKNCGGNVELIKGNILETVPSYLQSHPELAISLLHLDVDIYEPSKCVIDNLYPRLSRGGILVLDDYGIFPGATKAVDDYFKDKPEIIEKFPFALAPCYIVKK